MLVDAKVKVKVTMRGGYYVSAPLAASCLSYEKVVQMLIEGGAGVEVVGCTHRTILQIASIGGHERSSRC